VATASAVGRRVTADADRLLIESPETRALRAKLSALVGPYQASLPAMRARLPSYVNQALDDLSYAFDRWTREDADAG
jgi:hypothetical protein